MRKTRKKRPVREAPPDGWLSQQQAADLLDRSRLAVMGMVTRGEIEATVFAGRTFISKSSCDRYLQGAKVA